ncbi:ankyrin repeat domain-containing protein [Ekhidna sp.]
MQSGEFKALVQSVIDEDQASVQYYLSQGIDPNFLHPEILTTPLVEASRNGNVSISELLLNHGADPLLDSLIGESALKIAKQNKNKELMQLFTKKKKSPFSLHKFFKKLN